MNRKIDLSMKASMLRRKLGEDEWSPIDIFQLVQSIDNLSLVFYPLGKNISGVCYKGKESNVIAINSQMSVGRQRFSLAHELYHLYYDDKEKNSISLIKIGDGDEEEKNADKFASYFLIPKLSLYMLIEDIKIKQKRDKLGIEDVVKIEQYYGVSHKAMLYRLVEEGEIEVSEAKKMESGIIQIAARLGYDTEIYYSSPENKKMKVLGHYISKTEELLEKERISQGKYEELLLDAFRDDIVFGMEGDEDIPLD